MKSLAACVAAGLLLAAAGCRAQSATPPVAELSLRELYRLPVGPRGLEPSPRLLALDGHDVRIAGYMAQQADPLPGLFILSPLPVSLGDEDESYADDLPAAAVFVHLADGSAVVPPRPGRIALSGRLEIGARPETDGRISYVRLLLDAPTSRALIGAPALSLEKPDAASR